VIIPLFPTNYYFKNTLTDAINPALAAPLLLAAAKLMLGTGSFTPGLGTSFADLVEATFTGYAQSATVVWGTPINDVDTTPTSISPRFIFAATATASVPAVTCLGVTDGVASPSTGILASGLISPPIPMDIDGNGFAVVVDWNLGNVPGNLNATLIQ
jgi:hypothetical protein